MLKKAVTLLIGALASWIIGVAVFVSVYILVLSIHMLITNYYMIIMSVVFPVIIGSLILDCYYGENRY